ncbi:MAG TPA: flagellar biosynthesis protein FliP [Deltaproteobacteria bacterium]|nr:flagellar biosynthesis protein FliP [Deltaproteobacteria bacterium]
MAVAVWAGAAAADPFTLPAVSLTIGGEEGGPQGLSTTIQIIILLTVLSLAPAILIMMTSFTRIIIVFSLLRQAMGVQQAPPNQVLVGMALFLTLFVMGPTLMEINTRALAPYMDGRITQSAALENGLEPIRKFMLRNVRENDVKLFLQLARAGKPASVDEIPTRVLIPAFITSELKTAFQIGFLIYIPFLVIDMVVASVLMSMGMMMLPPVMISLPFKLMLFVLVDGWHILVGSLVKSFY